jgi:hypothetical protein
MSHVTTIQVAAPELAAAIRQLMLQQDARNRVTLGAVRASILKESTAWFEGELLHPQDRTSLINELDGLIDEYGMAANASHFLPEEC